MDGTIQTDQFRRLFIVTRFAGPTLAEGPFADVSSSFC
jgi:hypothetical protein